MRSTTLGMLAGLGLALSGCGNGHSDATDAGGGDADTDLVCDIAPSGPLWLTEGESVSFQVECRTGYDLEGLTVQLTPIPSGASYDAATRSFSWTTGLRDAAVYDLEILIPSVGESKTVRVGVADDWDHPDNVPVLDPERYPMELGLPVLFLGPEPTGSDDFVPVTVVYRGETLEGRAKRRGKSSLDYPKKSYALDFDTFNLFHETELAEFRDKRRVILTTTFDDNSYVRQRLCYELWRRLEPTIEIQAYNAVVYLDGEYWGLYTISDHPNGRLMQESGLSEDGNLYKAVNHDANFRLQRADGSDKETLHDGYEKTEGEPPEGEAGAFDDLEVLVELVADTDDGTFRASIEDTVEVSDYVAWWLLVTFTLAEDSAGKNSYHYHDATRSWRVVPWDFNHSFGQSWTTQRKRSDIVNHFRSNNELFSRLLDHPQIGPALEQRFADELSSGAFDRDELAAILDRYERETAASAQRDWDRWQDEYRSFSRWSDRTDFTSYTEEMDYLRTWVEERWAVFDEMY